MVSDCLDMHGDSLPIQGLNYYLRGCLGISADTSLDGCHRCLDQDRYGDNYSNNSGNDDSNEDDDDDNGVDGTIMMTMVMARIAILR